MFDSVLQYVANIHHFVNLFSSSPKHEEQPQSTKFLRSVRATHYTTRREDFTEQAKAAFPHPSELPILMAAENLSIGTDIEGRLSGPTTINYFRVEWSPENRPNSPDLIEFFRLNLNFQKDLFANEGTALKTNEFAAFWHERKDRGMKWISYNSLDFRALDLDLLGLRPDYLTADIFPPHHLTFVLDNKSPRSYSEERIKHLVAQSRFNPLACGKTPTFSSAQDEMIFMMEADNLSRNDADPAI